MLLEKIITANKPVVELCKLLPILNNKTRHNNEQMKGIIFNAGEFRPNNVVDIQPAQISKGG